MNLVLQTVLAEVFEKKDSSGRAFFPYLDKPVQIDNRVIPGGSIVFFPPKTKAIYGPTPGVRSANEAIIFIDDNGTCVRTAPSKAGGITAVLKLHDGRNLLSAHQFGEAFA